MSIIIKIATIGILTTIASILLKRAGREEMATVVSIVGLVLSLIIMIDMIVGLYTALQALFDT